MRNLTLTGQILRVSFAEGWSADSSARHRQGDCWPPVGHGPLVRLGCQGLVADGSVYFFDMIMRGGVAAEGPSARAFANVITQAPAVLAMKLGVNDFHWLARLLLAGLFRRADSPLLVRLGARPQGPGGLGGYAGCDRHGLHVDTVPHRRAAQHCLCLRDPGGGMAGDNVRSAAGDGLVLVAIAALAVRAYEHFVYLGPLLGLMVLRSMARAPAKPRGATALYGIAAALFLVGACVAAESHCWQNAVEEERAYMAAVLVDALSFRSISSWVCCRLPRQAYPFGASCVPTTFAAGGLTSPRVWFCFGCGVAGAGRHRLVVAPAYSAPQISSRTIAGPLAASFVVFVWLQASGRTFGLEAPSVLKEPGVARRLAIPLLRWSWRRCLGTSC